MKIGFLSVPLTGHLNPMTALARKLQSRGHEIVFYGTPDAETPVRAAGLKYVSYGEKELPKGTGVYDPVAKLHGIEVMQYTSMNISPILTKVALAYLPQKMLEDGIEAVVIDTIYFYAELVPMSLDLPYVHIWNVLHIDFSGETPLCLVDLPYEDTEEARATYMEAVISFGSFFEPIVSVASAYATRMGLDIDWANPAATVSPLAVITQTPKAFDYPGMPTAPQFHFAGPFHDGTGRAPVDFPWEKLDGRPLMYASLGTLVNGLDFIYKTILESVSKFPTFQVVLAIGKNVNLEDLGTIPSNVIVVKAAPQLELLKRASLCITHAGMNTTLESIAQGVPMIAIPISYDQPGAAGRIAYHGVGEYVTVEDLTTERLTELIRKVKDNPSYREKARSNQKIISEIRGLDIAADVIEEAFANSIPEEVVLEASNNIYSSI
jgi:zeaxanthin glucosyltransferase